MSNLANYSPYNKTYRFLMFQNQVYHERNKIMAKPCVRTNLRYNKNKSQDKYSYFNPEIRTSRKGNESPIEVGNGIQNQDGKYESSTGSLSRSFLHVSCRSLRDSNPQIDKKKLAVHKNESYEKFRNKQIQRQNRKLVHRLRSASCQVVKKQKTQRSFSSHSKYKQMIQRYDLKGSRKEKLVMGNNNLLNPILKVFNQSRIGCEFIQEHMSWLRDSYKKSNSHVRNSNNSWI